MLDRRRQLGIFAVFSLVVLRLAIGWHFYREGTSKLTYDKVHRRFDVTFSADGFLAQAKGPLAERYQSFAPSGHNWSRLLAAPEPDGENSENAAGPPYKDWLTRITDDWKQLVAKFAAIPNVSDEQTKAAEAALEARKKELSDYLAEESEAIADYRHELSRTEKLAAAPEASGVPFVESRVETEQAKNRRTPQAWVERVNGFDRDLTDDLRNLLTDEQRADAATADALTTDEAQRLHVTNLAVTIVTVGVGICLLIGFFTRLASLVGALFLAAVVASQPPWAPGTVATFNQIVELAGLLVLAGTGAGRWAGLDYFGYALWNRIRGGRGNT